MDRFESLFDLIRSARYDRAGLMFLVGFSGFINALYIVPSLIIISVYDRVLSTRSIETLAMLAILAGLVFVTVFLLDWLRSLIVIRLANRLDLDLSRRVFTNALELRRLGTKADLGAVPSDLTAFRQVASGTFVFSVMDIPWISVYLLILWFLHPAFALSAVLGGGVVLGIAMLVERSTHSDLDRSRTANSMAAKTYGTSLRSSETIYAMGFVGEMAKRWGDSQSEFLKHQSIASDKGSLLTSMNKSVRLALQFIPIALGAYLVLHESVSPGVMFAASILTGRALAPIDMLSNLLKSLQGASLSAGNIQQIIKAEVVAPSSVPLPTPRGLLTLEKLTVQPPQASEPSLKEVTHAFHPGTVTAVVGPSASGKSSMVKAIVGAWPPQDGEVRVDAALIEQYSETQRARIYGYLPQDVDLFDGTIGENIARFQNADPNDILEAATAAGVHELIKRLPNGYDTPLHDGGKNLSGGFRQRVGLARAMYGWPKIVVLDEPNSHLDEPGEMALKSAIATLKAKGSTIILVTHRASLLAVVDSIMVIVGGRISKQGPRSDFVRSQGPAVTDANGANNA